MRAPDGLLFIVFEMTCGSKNAGKRKQLFAFGKWAAGYITMGSHGRGQPFFRNYLSLGTVKCQI